MDLSRCKLIESCDMPNRRKKYSIFPAAISKSPKKSEIRLPKIHRSNKSPEPRGLSASMKRSNQNKHHSLIKIRNDSPDLKISCRKYKIPSVLPKDLVKEAKQRNSSYKFMPVKAYELLSNYSSSPRSLSPAMNRQFFGYLNKFRLSENN